MPLPWVRLHCLKDYLDMLKIVQRYPNIHVTFNFSPSLLLQIQDYQSGRCTDYQFLLFKKNAEDLSLEEKVDILRDFFLANWKEMIEPYPRYFSLLLKRGKNIVEEELLSIVQRFTVDEFRDLQIWANLAWIDPAFRGALDDLYKKGKNFSEADKERIIELENKIIGSIFDEYKKSLQSGQIEITTSPLYHPILPLLIDSKLASVSDPNLKIPFEFSCPDDAVHQVAEAVDVYEKIFGQKPKGFWPSEGGVCHELLPIVASLGIEWIATDEAILARSLGISLHRDENGVPNHPELLYRPWLLENVKIIFRDHILSDLIGFEYNKWESKNAALDFIARIKYIRKALPGSGKFCIPIILDGENAWESYKNDGEDFLKNLYENLLKENIPTTTITRFLQDGEIKETLPTLFPGSWINANFDIWIGQSEDHKGWQIIKRVREKMVQKGITDMELWNRLYILEGSDWFWWFGREYYFDVVDFFDELFRINVAWIYRKMGEEPPGDLFSPIHTWAEIFSSPPIDKMTPVIDGQITHFYEWSSAGHADVKRMGGTMHRFAGLFSIIHCGFDDKNLYIRFDVENHDILSYEYKIKFYEPKELEIFLGKSEGIVYKIQQVGEVAIPLSSFELNKEGIVEFVIGARQGEIEVDRTPLLKFSIKLSDVRLQNWIV